MMRQRIIALLIVFLWLVPASSLARKNRPQDLEYLSEDGTWLLGYVQQLSQLDSQEAIRQSNQFTATTGRPVASGLNRVICKEPGDYHSFILFLPPNKNLWWTKKSQVIFRLENGRLVASEKCLFTTDQILQDQIFDSSKKSIIATRDLGPWGTKGGILLIAKFPPNSFDVHEAIQLTVVNVSPIDQSIRGR